VTITPQTPLPFSSTRHGQMVTKCHCLSKAVIQPAFE
jgi:hypothetical protein